MKLYENIEDINKPFPNAVVTIGNFDGVHIGHQSLFHEVVLKAASLGGTAVAITFDPHPLRVLTKGRHPPLITLNEQKKELIAATELDVLIIIPFTKAFAAVTARDFICEWLVKRIGMKAIVVGRDYSFGKNREGDIHLLESLGEQHHFEVVLANWIKSAPRNEGRISSTRIRELVADGAIEKARHLLGRYYQIRGEVIRGRNRGGKLLGFPTANLALQDELCPKTGIYAVTVEWQNRRYQGVANIGYSPTFDDHLFTVEVHILDFDQDLYGQKIKINFLKRIRDEVKFESIEALSDQIRRDIAVARTLFEQ
ncbi:MAG: bifunctional riboflavin kinase/FAD synthetase [Desulfobacterales bacterium]